MARVKVIGTASALYSCNPGKNLLRSYTWNVLVVREFVIMNVHTGNFRCSLY